MTGVGSLKFFIIGGVILIASGLLQLLVRPRKANEVGLARYLNRGTMWAGFCVLVGLGAILVGMGAVPLPIQR